jgi:hypothetical protein
VRTPSGVELTPTEAALARAWLRLRTAREQIERARTPRQHRRALVALDGLLGDVERTLRSEAQMTTLDLDLMRSRFAADQEKLNLDNATEKTDG